MWGLGGVSATGGLGLLEERAYRIAIFKRPTQKLD
jgi:hypothetical protein